MTDSDNSAPPGTLYAVAGEAMDAEIEIYLDLAKVTDGFSRLDTKGVATAARRRIILGGIGSPLSPDETTPEQ